MRYTKTDVVMYLHKIKLNITNIVNGTPDIILDKIDTHSLNWFTNYVKLLLLQTYQDTCTEQIVEFRDFQDQRSVVPETTATPGLRIGVHNRRAPH